MTIIWAQKIKNVSQIRAMFHATKKQTDGGLLIRNDDDFSPVVISAVFANSVVQLLFVALRAFNQGRSADFPISRSGVLSLLRSFSFRYCHIFRLPLTYIVLVYDKLL